MLLLVLAVTAATTARAEQPLTEGRIEAEGARVEVLGRQVRVGERVDLPEGWFRVEEAGPEDGRTGSFSIVPAASLHPTATALAGAPGPAPEGAALAAAPPPQALPCRAERARYLETLWKTSGIQVDSPDLLIEGLEGPDQGARLGFYWFALATDPFRPLAWNSDLQDRADELTRCMREARLAAR